MRLALLWALGLLGAGSPLPSRPLPRLGGTDDEKEKQARPDGAWSGAWSGSLEALLLRDHLGVNSAEVLQIHPPEALQINLELDGEDHILELLPNRELVSDRPTLVWYQPDGTRVVSEGHTLGNCCYQGRVRGHVHSWASICICSGLWGLVVLSPERSYSLELRTGNQDSSPRAVRIHRSLLPGRTCIWNGHGPVPSHSPTEPPRGPHHSRWRRDVVTETKILELVIVADHSEVQKYPDFQHLLNRSLEVVMLLDTFFQPLNVRVALVGLEAWTQHDLVEISQDPGVTLDNFLRWRRTDLLPRLPHDNAQLMTATVFSGPAVGLAVQNSICSPELSGGVNMDHSTSILGVASSMAHELGHSLGLGHDLPGNSCPCPGPAPAKTCIMEASTDFLQGLNFSNCSRQALERALLAGMGSCLFAQAADPHPMTSMCGNQLVEPGEQCDCGFPDDCTDPCCDYFTCQLRSGAQCASQGPCCENCQLRAAGGQCRPARGECDLPEFCTGDSAQCPPDLGLGDGEPCANGAAVCMHGRCASYVQQCQGLWGPGAQPAAPLCLQTANAQGNAFGSCGRHPNGSYMACVPSDAICGQLQCQGGGVQPLLGTAQELRWETLEANGTRFNCSRVRLDLGGDVMQPLLALPGTTCGPGLVCIDRRCQSASLLGAQECRRKCHGHGVCNSNSDCHCEKGWAPPDCATQIRATGSLTTGLLLSLLLLLVLVLLGASYWHRARLRQRLCQLKGPSCQYRAAQPTPPERPGPPQRTLLMPGAKTSAGGFPAAPSRPLPPDPVHKRLQAELVDRPNPPSRPLPADPVVRRPKCEGPTKPPPPRKALPTDPTSRRPSGDAPGPEAGFPPSVIPSRPAPPPPVSSIFALPLTAPSRT